MEEVNSSKVQWYVVSCQSGKEWEVKANIDNRRVTMGMEDLIIETCIAEQEVEVTRTNKNTGEKEPTGKTKIKNLYPRYLFVKMVMTDEAWYVIRNTPGVTGFIGSSGKGTKPTPVPQEQMAPVLKICGKFNDTTPVLYKVGDKVKILRSIYSNAEGIIKEVDKENQLLIVEIQMISGRTAMGQFDFSEVQLMQ